MGSTKIFEKGNHVYKLVKTETTPRGEIHEILDMDGTGKVTADIDFSPNYSLFRVHQRRTFSGERLQNRHNASMLIKAFYEIYCK